MIRKMPAPHPSCGLRQIDPTGKSLSGNPKFGFFNLSSPFGKNISVVADPKSPPDNTHPVPVEGAYRAIVTDVGYGMRWTRAASGALRRAGRRRSLRTAKPWGPGTPTLVSSLRD